MDEKSEKKVVVCLGKRKRIVSFSSSDGASDKAILMKRIKEEFSDKLPCSDEYEIVLQMKNIEMDEFIEVTDRDKIESKATLEFFVEEMKCSQVSM